jgi:hypothetical protein
MELQENTGNHGRGVFAWGVKACGNVQIAAKRPLCQRKTGVRMKKNLRSIGTERKSRKRPTLVVGKKPNGKSQFNSEKERSV